MLYIEFTKILIYIIQVYFMSVTLAKVGVESSSLFSRSKFKKSPHRKMGAFFMFKDIFNSAYLMQVDSFLAQYNLA